MQSLAKRLLKNLLFSTHLSYNQNKTSCIIIAKSELNIHIRIYPLTICYDVITSIPSCLLLVLKIVITSQPQALLIAEKMWQIIDQIQKKKLRPTKMRFHNFHKKK
jgi:hypothetical protein